MGFSFDYDGYHYEYALSGATNTQIIATVTKITYEEETAELIGSFIEGRARAILQHQPDAERRLDRLNGSASPAGNVSAFGLTIANSGLPFDAMFGPDGGRFAYSLQRSRAAQGDPSVSVSPAGMASALGARPYASSTEPLAYDGSADLRRERPGSDGNGSGEGAGDEDAGYGYPAGQPVEDRFAGDGPAQSRYDIWVEGVVGRQRYNGGENDFVIGHAGFDYLATPNLLVGLGGQIDWADYDAGSDATASGTGFMIGPYATARLSDNFYVDGRLAWGQSYNKLSPLGTYEDDMDAERFLATAALIGKFDYGGLILTPELRLNWFREETDGYVDSLGVAIPSYTVEAGELAFGPTIEKSFMLDNGMVVTPELALRGIWTFAHDNTALAASGVGIGFADEGLRGRVGLGMRLRDRTGLSLAANVDYDGIGEDDYEAIGGRLSLSKSW